MAARAEIERRIAQCRMLVHQQAFSFAILSQLHGQMKGERGYASTSLCADQSDNLPAHFRPGSFLLLRFHACQSFDHTVLLHRLQQIFSATRTHGCDDRLRLGMGGYSEALDFRILGVQSLRDPDRFLGILVVVDKANPRVSEVQCAAYLSFSTSIMIQISQDYRLGYDFHEMGKRLIRRGIKAYSNSSHSSWSTQCIHVHLLPNPCGVSVSNRFCSSSGTGILGNSGTPVGDPAGSTIVGVTITTSSEFDLLTDRERKSWPITGRSPIPGTLENCDVVLWSSNPAIPKLWPSRKSTMVSAWRVAMAGSVNPLMTTAFAKSSELTSGSTFNRMVSSSSIVPVKSNLMPKGLNCTVTVVCPAAPVTTG